MNTHRWLVTILLCFSFCACRPTRSIEEQLCKESIDWYACQVKKKGNFKISSCNACIEDDIEKISITVIVKDCLNIGEARKLFVNSVEEFIAYINCDKEVRPYLHIYPFLAGRLEFAIFFESENKQWIEPPYIAKILLNNYVVTYYTYDSEKKIMVDFFEESYQESTNITNNF